MRLDKFLKVSRLIKRRSVANDVSDKGFVYVNDKLAKPSKQVKIGDLITIVYNTRKITVKILEVPTTNVPAQLASSLYEEFIT